MPFTVHASFSALVETAVYLTSLHAFQRENTKQVYFWSVRVGPFGVFKSTVTISCNLHTVIIPDPKNYLTSSSLPVGSQQ